MHDARCLLDVRDSSLAGVVPAGALQFTDGGIGTQGLLSFTPGVGTGVLTIGAGNGGLGGLITVCLRCGPLRRRLFNCGRLPYLNQRC